MGPFIDPFWASRNAPWVPAVGVFSLYSPLPPIKMLKFSTGARRHASYRSFQKIQSDPPFPASSNQASILPDDGPFVNGLYPSSGLQNLLNEPGQLPEGSQVLALGQP